MRFPKPKWPQGTPWKTLISKSVFLVHKVFKVSVLEMLALKKILLDTVNGRTILPVN